MGESFRSGSSRGQDVLMDTRGPFVDGQAIRGDCVPQSDKSERGDFDVRTFIVTFAT